MLQLFQSDVKNVWSSEKPVLLQERSLDRLFRGSIPAIIIPKAISLRDCDQLVRNLVGVGMSQYSHVNHPVSKHGLTQMEYFFRKDKSDYFANVEKANANYRAILLGVESDPLQIIMRELQKHTPGKVGIAVEKGAGANYYAGSFRNITSIGHLHFDFAPLESPGWSIADIQSQLSWNVYLNVVRAENWRA